MLKISQHAHKICRFSNDCELTEITQLLTETGFHYV